MLSAFCASPYAAARSTPVNVVNFPEVQAVEEINQPAFQPAQFYNTRFTEIDGPGTTLLSTGVEADPEDETPVPDGKRLVVQHVSYQMRSGGMEGQPLCGLRVRDDFDTVVRHPLPLTLSMFRDDRVVTVSTPITVYVDPGHSISVSCSVLVTDDVNQTLGLTGYFIDMLP